MRKFNRTMPVDLIRTLFKYNPETGALTWARSVGKYRAGESAIYVRYRKTHGDFKVCINLFKTSFQANRVIWAHVTGSFPADDEEVDHKDRDRRNNRWENLRKANRSQNQANTGLYKNNKAQVRGVHQTESGRWRAMISERGKNRHIGLFDTADAAHAAWKREAQKAHGEFANV